MKHGRYPNLDDRDDLWKLLVTITRHKLSHLMRDQNRKKRGGDWQQLTGESQQLGHQLFIQEFADSEPTPEIAAEFAEQCTVLLSKLPNQELVELAILKMEGYTNAEIASGNKRPSARLNASCKSCERLGWPNVAKT